MQKDLHHIEKCFTAIDGYPKWLLKQISAFLKTSKDNCNNINNNNSGNNRDINISSDRTAHALKLPHIEDQGIKVTKSRKKLTKKKLPDNHGVRIISTGTKLSSLFNIKDDTRKQDRHDLVCSIRCPSIICTDSYLGETCRHASEQVVMELTQMEHFAHVNILNICLRPM